MEILYELREKSAYVSGFEGTGVSFTVPDKVLIDDNYYVVRGVAKKALLGCVGLRNISLPGTVAKIEDWAFSGCAHLEKFVVRATEEKDSEPINIEFGRGVFDKCALLRDMLIGYGDSDDRSVLLAVTVNRLPADYILKNITASDEDFFKSWDLALSTFLNNSDFDGSDAACPSGEEDISYDYLGSIDGEMPSENSAFVDDVRENKAYLCLLRLKYNRFISSETEKKCRDYMAGTHNLDGRQSAWQVIKKYFSDNRDYINLFLDETKPDNKKVEELLSELGDNHALCKSILIGFGKDEKSGEGDFFSDFSL
ncbi:MAG: leucine-rich repeat domain-containing protein [Acetatifactor sp.]|nr:leucine-rich repeat domain-containing protein [Acetatifactor sp.]